MTLRVMRVGVPHERAGNNAPRYIAIPYTSATSGRDRIRLIDTKTDE
jgi:hypothetical protein